MTRTMNHRSTRTRAPQRLLAGLAGLALLAGLGLGTATPADALTRRVNEYEGQHRLAAEAPFGIGFSRRVNEYEGQHRRAGGKVPEVPVVTD